MKVSLLAVYMAILISLAGVVIHIGALIVGLPWLVFFRAPVVVTDSFTAGTWLAPVGGVVIAGSMGLCGYYAASAMGLVPRPPLQRAGLVAMTFICTIRVLLLPALAFRHPALYDTFEVVAAIVWGFAAVGFAFALALVQRTLKPSAT